MIKITAKFKGADGSLGYKTGEKYSLWFAVKNGHGVVIYREDSTAGGCLYSSLKSFLDNWEVV